MQRRLEFSRKVRRVHLDYVWEHILAYGAVSATEFDAFLSVDITGLNRRTKARGELMKLFTSEATAQLVKRARELNRDKRLTENDRIGFYWALFIVAFPFVHQVFEVVGRFGQLGDQFTRASLVRRLADIYGGGRTTIISIDEVLGMMAEWGIIVRKKPGEYAFLPERAVSKGVQRILLTGMCLSRDPPVYPLRAFADEQSLFPFKRRLSIADVRTKNAGLIVSVQGGNEVMVEPK